MMKLTKGIPSVAKSCRGPIPESNNSFGDPTTPALSKVKITQKSMILASCKMMINRMMCLCCQCQPYDHLFSSPNPL